MNDYERQLNQQELQQGQHREFVGGLWDTIGELQFQFLLKQGLSKNGNLIDIGCGCLRGGVRLIKYLDKGRYYGIDINESLLDAGYDCELVKYQLQDRLPRENLLTDTEFAFWRFGVQFETAFAHSLFTHLSLNHIRLCLIELAKVLKPDGKFFATFFECQDPHPLEKELVHTPGNVITHLAADPYHYRLEDIYFVADMSCWEVRYIGNWNHPRNQKMLCLTRK